MFGSKQKEKDRKTARLVLDIALFNGKVAIALDAIQKLGREPNQSDRLILADAIKPRRDETVIDDLKAALSYLELSVQDADLFTSRVLELDPQYLANVHWKKISYELWEKLFDRLFAQSNSHELVYALRARADIPREKLHDYCNRVMKHAVDHGDAWALYISAAMSESEVERWQTRELLAGLMKRKVGTMGEARLLLEDVYKQAGIIAA